MILSLRVALPLALFCLFACGKPEALPAGSRVAIMSALPLFGTTAQMGDIINGPDQRAAITKSLAERFDLRPIDHLTAERLGGEKTLIVAQPRLLSPEELVILDDWISGGGRALIFTDPALSWPSNLPMGDRRRPPPIGLLDPLLAHWGLVLDDAAPEQGIVRARLEGMAVALARPGRWSSSRPSCNITDDRLVAECRVGKGRALLVADADLLDERLWDETGIDNRSVVHALLQRVAGPNVDDGESNSAGKGGT